MKISTRSRYGLRMMIRLAEAYGEGPLDLRGISRSEGLSLKYLGQIALALRAAGLITARRGVGGGYMLMRRPREYTLLEIIEAVDGPVNIIDCTEPGWCRRESTCAAREFWGDLNDTIRMKLERKRLDELEENSPSK